MNRSIASWEIHGTGHFVDHGFRIGRVQFRAFTETRRQEWSPRMHEVTRYWGVRIGSWRVSISRTHLEWFDGQEPAREAREYCA